MQNDMVMEQQREADAQLVRMTAALSGYEVNGKAECTLESVVLQVSVVVDGRRYVLAAEVEAVRAMGDEQLRVHLSESLERATSRHQAPRR